jgi:hypothetical protein
MSAEMIQSIVQYWVTVFFGIITAIISFFTPIQEELPQLINKPNPTPSITEEIRVLTREEQTTMSASFIKEFQVIISSRSGNR